VEFDRFVRSDSADEPALNRWVMERDISVVVLITVPVEIQRGMNPQGGIQLGINHALRSGD